MRSSELRAKFINFFKEKGHFVLPSASLVPENDPTVHFATAGMFPFKKYYLSPDEAPASRVATVQKCVRTGDIDEVGDKTHLTFFEMLGNFSFGYPEKEGSYFKEETIKFAWEFLTEVLKVDKSRIHATYFNGEDNVGLPVDYESKELIKKITQLENDRIIGQPYEDNFWTLGTVGSPGGPTIEFYIDNIEVWNLVFNEFYWKGDRWETLKAQGVDTGMGFERLLACLDGRDNVFETDLFELILKEIEQISGKKYSENEKEFRTVADHIKTAVFILNEGVVPSNKDRGYVLRRLIRGAVSSMRILGYNDHFTVQIAKVVNNIYCNVHMIDIQSVFEELEKEENKIIVAKDSIEKEKKEMAGVRNQILAVNHTTIEDIRRSLARYKFKDKVWDPWFFIRSCSKLLSDNLEEIENQNGGEITFLKNLSYVLASRLEFKIGNIDPKFKEKLLKLSRIAGQEREKLKNAGFPKKVKLDELFLQEIRQSLSMASDLAGDFLFNLKQSYGATDADFIEMFDELGLDKRNSAITQIFLSSMENQLKKHQDLSRTASAGMFKGGLADAGVETTKLHTAAHLLLRALRQVLGEDVYQKGSNITAERLRFDFSYPEKMTPEQIGQVEDIVNEKIAQDLTVQMEEMTLEQAKKVGAMGVFDSKYGEKVKVYTIGDFSKEICGGPHMTHTGELGHFKIQKEESSSSGVRRIKAVLE